MLIKIKQGITLYTIAYTSFNKDLIMPMDPSHVTDQDFSMGKLITWTDSRIHSCT